jgi:transposase InsO family protein
MKKINNHGVILNDREKFRLKVMDAYEAMEPKNVRYLCRLFGIHHATFYRIKGRYRRFNLNTIKLKSRRPKRMTTIPWPVVVEICRWKRDNPAKSHYYLYQEWKSVSRIPPCSPKTIYNWWKKRNLIVIRHRRKRRKTKLFNSASVPGELVQIDTKYLNGRQRFQYTAIDVVSKYRYLRVYSKQTQENTLDFLKRLIIKFGKRGINMLLIQTDNGHEFQKVVVEFLTMMGIKHQYIWIHTPDQNGVVERSHRTDDEEFYQLTDTRFMTLNELNEAVENWTEHYNSKRLHFSLNFVTPEKYLVSHI